VLARIAEGFPPAGRHSHLTGAPAGGAVTGALTWLKRRGTYTSVWGGTVPIPRRRFETAKGLTLAGCNGEQALMCAPFTVNEIPVFGVVDVRRARLGPVPNSKGGAWQL